MYFSVTWQSRLLNKVRDSLETDGHTVSTERENWFKLKGRSGAVASPGRLYRGCIGRLLVYGDGTEIYIPATAVDDNCKEGPS